jgi:hypothetical protein
MNGTWHEKIRQSIKQKSAQKKPSAAKRCEADVKLMYV